MTTASAPPDPAGFVAHSALVDDPAADGVAAFARRVSECADVGVLVAGAGRIVAGSGVAATLPLPNGLEDEDALLAVRAWLASVEDVASDGSAASRPGAMALGAFPFGRSAPAVLTVPLTAWCRATDGRTWRVEVRGRNARSRPPTRSNTNVQNGRRDRAAPNRAALRQVPEPDGYADAVARAVAEIRKGEMAKVVLARMVEARLPAPAIPSRLLAALWGGDDVFSPFSVPTPTGRLVGASPELLISRCGRTITSHAFAGTVPLSESDGEADTLRLFNSVKDRNEHRLAVAQIASALEPRCIALSVPAEPTAVRLRSDARLGTLIRGTLKGSDSDADTALALLALLHPTPAVGGVPRAVALEQIASLEAAPRGYWAGAVGWTDGRGDGEWVLAIRSVDLDDDAERALVWAGAGIVEGSDPRGELAETTVKLRPVLEALWPGASALL